MIIKCPNPVKKRKSSKLAEKGKLILLIEEHKAFATCNILTYDLLLLNYRLIWSLTLARLLSCPVLISSVISSVQSLSRVRLFVTPWIAALQASLSITNSRSSPKLKSIKLVMPSRHLILCHPLLLLHPIPPSIRVFSNESTLHMRWPKYWSFSFNISSSNEHPGLISFRMDWLDLLAVHGLSRVFSNTIVQKIK